MATRTLLARPLWGPATDDLEGVEVAEGTLAEAAGTGRPGVRAVVPVNDRVD